MQGVIYWGCEMKYITAIFLALSVVCGILAYYYRTKANSYCELWKNSQANTDFLIKQREKNYEKALETSKRQEELEELAKASEEPCWSRAISPVDPVLVRLHQD